MKQFLTVLKFELTNYFKNKGYMITTILISLVLMVGLSLPTFFNFSFLMPNSSDNGHNLEENQGSKDGDVKNFALYNEGNVKLDMDGLKLAFPNSNWENVDNEDDLVKLVNEEKVEAGFIINSFTDYGYYVKNSGFTDSNQGVFEEYLQNQYRKTYVEDKGLNFEELNSVYSTQINSQVNILGKDGVSNYMYAYILIFTLYMMILLYGQLIAVSVTSEKSNRAMEVLITSTSSNSLIFGKVIAGAIASILQVGTILTVGIISYSINKNAWNGLLDGIFNIPSNILLTFAFFGTLGYLFYAFMFGSLGALVSKTEDISSSVGPIMMIFVAVFLITIFGMTNSNGMLIKVASFVPFSSFMAMLVRVALGTVSTMEIVISFVILLVSTGIVAIMAAKIYRLGTLMYGNPIKFKNIFKLFKKQSS